MDTRAVQAFFDRLAPGWDAETVRGEEIIKRILDEAGVKKGVRVLDVACGTGVLIPDYLARGAAKIVGVDLSPEMIRIARAKFPQEKVELVCGDAARTRFEGLFDVIMIYNAFPHFPDPEGLIAQLAAYLAPGGSLTVAHGASRKAIDEHHKGAAHGVSMGLMPAEDLAAVFAKNLHLSSVISNDKMYLVSGRK